MTRIEDAKKIRLLAHLLKKAKWKPIAVEQCLRHYEVLPEEMVEHLCGLLLSYAADLQNSNLHIHKEDREEYIDQHKFYWAIRHETFQVGEQAKELFVEIVYFDSEHGGPKVSIVSIHP